MMRKGTIYIGPLDQRFLEKFAVGMPNECWEWQGQKTIYGYGKLRLNAARKNIYAHRYAYMRHHGIVLPPGQTLIVMHTCDNPPCVNPAHLRLGTMAANNIDKALKGRHPRIGNHGTRSGTAKLTENIVPLLRQRIAAGETMTKIANERGVRVQAIWAMYHRRTWSHVP